MTELQEYPPDALDVREVAREFRDDAAAKLFKDAGGWKLVKANEKLYTALLAQAEKLVQFHSTPFTGQNIKTIKTTLEAIERTEAMLERWHFLMYPNQKPKESE